MKEILEKLQVRVLGNQNSKRKLLFSHGFGTTQKAWEKLIPYFEKNYQIIVYDYAGASSATEELYVLSKYKSLEGFAFDLLEIMEALTLENVIFIGHSASCMIGLLAAKQKPELFERLVMINGSACYQNLGDYQGGFDPETLEQIYKAMEDNFQLWAAGFAPMAYGTPDVPDYAREFTQSLSSIRPDIAVHMARIIFSSDYRNEIKGFDIPTLLLQSRKDLAVPLSASQYLNNNMPSSTLKIIEVNGHLPHLSHPAHLIEHIEGFINEQQDF